MKGLLATLFFSLIFSASLAKNISEEPPLIKVKQGSIKGIKEVSLHGKKFDSYYNIPYAEPPINHLRFKDPVPKSSWKGVHDGSKKPQMCPFPLYYDALTAGDSGNMKIYGDEDCLILNVFTPKSRIQKSNIPVMFYIHGGGYYQGSAFEYEPYFLMDEDIVLVVIQYRLGVLGFLSTEDDVLPGNMGLKDQQLALKWVNENIDCFGGDPNQVTIFGGSAGAASVNLQMLSPGSKGLFQGAIMQGGGALCSFSYQTDSLKYAKITGDHFNCSLDKGTQNYVECMRSIDVRPLIEFEIKISKSGIMTTTFVPRVDGDFLPDRPEVLIKNGNYNKVNVISGISRDEGSASIMAFAIKPKILDDLNNNFEKYGPESLMFENEENPLDLTVKAYNYYLNKTTPITQSDFDNFVKLSTDRGFKVPLYLLGKFLSKDPDVDIYLYEMDHFGAVSDSAAIPGYDRHNWITHQDSIYYLFGTGGPRFYAPITEESDIKVRNFYVKAWTNFAKYGDPNVKSLPCNCSWDPATEKSFRYLSLKEYPEMKDFTFPAFQNLWSQLNTIQNKILIKD
ncbi:UNVERIFIED_CONTAM: hypothetical protein RMT77_003589 [Armadillidium vulgare]